MKPNKQEQKSTLFLNILTPIYPKRGYKCQPSLPLTKYSFENDPVFSFLLENTILKTVLCEKEAQLT